MIGSAIETSGASTANVLASDFLGSLAIHHTESTPFGTVVVRDGGRARLEGCTFEGTTGGDDLRPRQAESRIFTDTPAAERAVREGSCCGEVLPLAQATGPFLEPADDRFLALQQVRWPAPRCARRSVCCENVRALLLRVSGQIPSV